MHPINPKDEQNRVTSEPNPPARRSRRFDPYRAQRERLMPKVGEARWNVLWHDARLAASLWTRKVQLQCQGLHQPVWPRLRRGFWVRYIGGRGELQQPVPFGSYGQVVATAGPIYVLFDHLRRPLSVRPDLVEVVPAPPPNHRRWHLRQVERRWKAIRRARAVWGEGYEPIQLQQP